MTTAKKIKVGTVKQIKCSRCKGTGMTGFTWVCHLGIPGLCVKCDGVGTVERLTAEQKRARKINRTIKHLAELEDVGRNAVITANEHASPDSKRTDENGWWRMDAERVEVLRERWTLVNNELRELLAS